MERNIGLEVTKLCSYDISQEMKKVIWNGPTMCSYDISQEMMEIVCKLLIIASLIV